MAKSPDRFLPPPIEGIDWRGPVMDADLTTAYHIANFICRENDLYSPGGLEAPSAPLVGTGTAETLWANAAADVFYTRANGIFSYAGVLKIAITNALGSWLNASVAGGQYCFFFNGTDIPKVETGGVWANIAWGGASVKTDLFAATIYRQRLYALDKNRLGFWYLPAGAITGVELFYDMGTVCAKGGYVLAIGTLTLDSGNGPDDLLAVYTSMGEVALFSGNDPGATDWNPVGVYFVGRPFGGFNRLQNRPIKLMAKLGGDLLILTGIGIVSLYQIMRGESIATIKCLTDKIWPGVRWLPSRTARLDIIGYLGVLLFSFDNPNIGVYVLNLRTGAWSRLVEDPTNPGNQLGDCHVWLESPTNDEVYTIPRWNLDAVYVAFRKESNAGYGMSCDHVIQYNFSRLQMLEKLQNFDIRPMFVAEVPFEISVGMAKNLGYDYREQTIEATTEFWTNIQSYSHYPSVPPDRYGFAPEYMTQRWLTVANDISQCSALRLRATLPNTNPERGCQFLYIGSDLRNMQGGMLGP